LTDVALFKEIAQSVKNVSIVSAQEPRTSSNFVLLIQFLGIKIYVILIMYHVTNCCDCIFI